MNHCTWTYPGDKANTVFDNVALPKTGLHLLEDLIGHMDFANSNDSDNAWQRLREDK